MNTDVEVPSSIAVPLPDTIMSALKALRTAAYKQGTYAGATGDALDSAAEFRHATQVIAAALAPSTGAGVPVARAPLAEFADKILSGSRALLIQSADGRTFCLEVATDPADSHEVASRTGHMGLLEARNVLLTFASLMELRAEPAVPAPSADPDGLTLAQRLDKEEAEHTKAVARRDDQDGPGLTVGDVAGMYHRIREAAGLCGDAPRETGAPDLASVVQRIRSAFSNYPSSVLTHDQQSAVEGARVAARMLDAIKNGGSRV